MSCRKDYCKACRKVTQICDGICGECGAYIDEEGSTEYDRRKSMQAGQLPEVQLDGFWGRYVQGRP